MEPDELEAAKNLLGPGNSATSDSFDSEKEKFRKIINEGAPEDVFALGEEKGWKPTQIENFQKKQDEAKEKKRLNAEFLTLVDQDIKNIKALINMDAENALGGKSARALGFFGLRSLSSGIGNATIYLEQLQSSAFMQNVDKLRGMGALSNAEGDKLASAKSLLPTLLGRKNEDGSKQEIPDDDEIAKILDEALESAENARNRYLSGKRIDINTGEEISLEEYNAKNPDLPAPPIDQIKADDNKEKGINDPNTLDFRDPVSKLSMSEQMTEAVKKANLNYDSYPSGFTIIFPNGTVKRKR